MLETFASLPSAHQVGDTVTVPVGVIYPSGRALVTAVMFRKTASLADGNVVLGEGHIQYLCRSNDGRMAGQEQLFASEDVS